MSASIQSQSETAKSSRFWDLPQELRDEIYGFAFGFDGRTVNVIWRDEWMARENDKRQTARRSISSAEMNKSDAVSYEIKRFLGSLLMSMVVSKQFYREAVKTWREKITFEFDQTEHLRLFIKRCPQGFLANVKKISTRLCALDCLFRDKQFCKELPKCIGIRELVVVIDNGLKLSTGKFDSLDELEDKYFANLQIMKHIRDTPSIQSLKILPGKHGCAESRSELELFRNNLDKLAVFIMRQFESRRSRVAQETAASASSTKAASSQVSSNNASSSKTIMSTLGGFLSRSRLPFSSFWSPVAVQQGMESMASQNGGAKATTSNRPFRTCFIRPRRDATASTSKSVPGDILRLNSPGRRFRVSVLALEFAKKEAFFGMLCIANTVGIVALYFAIR